MRFVLLLLILVSCGHKNPDRENYGDITNSPGGIVIINPEEHQGGFGRSQCLLCHNADLNIHRGANSLVDVNTLNELIRQNGLNAYCLNCHGDNGQ